MLPNGLRAVLISDVAAMNQIQSEGGMFVDEDGEEDDEENEKDDAKTSDDGDDEGDSE